MLEWVKQRLWPVAWRTLQEWNSDEGGLLAASLSFYTAFSFFPLILVLLSTFGFVLRFSERAQEAQQELLKVVSDATAPVLAQQVGQILAEVETNAGFGGPLGLATLLFGAIGIFANMDIAFARIWKTHEIEAERSGVLQMVMAVLFTRLKAFLVVLGLGVFVVAAFLSSIVLAAIGSYANDVPLGNSLFHWMQIGAGVLLNTIFFTYTYKLFALRPAYWWECLKGGVLAAMFWEVGRQILAWYLVRGSYSAYGVVGSFVAMMAWFYYAWTILFFGAEYVQVCYRMRLARIPIHAKQPGETATAVTSSPAPAEASDAARQAE